MPYKTQSAGSQKAKLEALTIKFRDRSEKRKAKEAARRREEAKTKPQRHWDPSPEELKRCVLCIKLKGRLPEWAPKRWAEQDWAQRAMTE